MARTRWEAGELLGKVERGAAMSELGVSADSNLGVRADSNLRRFNTYNSFNEVLTTKDPLLVTTTMTYDAKGNLGSVARPLTGTSSTQTVTYNHAKATFPGDVTSMVDPDSKTWSYGYDGNGYRNAVTDPLGNKSTTVSNADGWMV